MERRTTPTNRYSRRSLGTLLGFLNRMGVLPVEAASEQTLPELQATEFERYLVSERGLLPRTAAAQGPRVRRFLAEYCPAGGVGELSTAEIMGALLAEGDHHAVSSVKRLGYTLRSFLRYAFLTGLISHDLSDASIPVQAYQPSMLPIGISREPTTALCGHVPPTPPGVRTLFLAGRAPRRPMNRVTVSSMIGRACVRAGIAPVGAHLLRHTLGEAMIRAEVPLAAIGQVLRHHDPLTTTKYARVDVERLREPARPWRVIWLTSQPAGAAGGIR